MKKLIQLSLLCFPLIAAAQPPAMSQQGMEKMMQGIEECMRNVDRSAIKSMASKAKAMQKRIEALCQAGKRDQAQNLAFEFAIETASSEPMKQARKCGEMMREMMPRTPFPSEDELKQSHICDRY